MQIAKLLEIGSTTIAIVAAIASSNISVKAQIIPDSTLGTESSTVTPQGGRDLIEGGAIRGSNLFHSFQEFNVNDGQQVNFANPNASANILTRVTGQNPSSILGTLGVDGAANLFLINPNGIVFGQNARLNIGGSFIASTASGLKFADGTQFLAESGNPTVPLLTISVPMGLQFNQPNPGAITVNGSNLAVPTHQTLALVGGDVNISGGRISAGGSPFVLVQGIPVAKPCCCWRLIH